MKKQELVRVANNGEILDVIVLKSKAPTLKRWITFFIQEIKSVFNGSFRLKVVKSRSPKPVITKESVETVQLHLMSKYGVPID